MPEQVLLPLCLAFIMLCLGLRLSVDDFIRVFRRLDILALGLSLQFFALPLLAVLLIKLLQLPDTVAIGLLLVALAPGGATSNAITALCRGDVALSVGLTGVSSLLVPLSLPLLWQILVPWLGQTSVPIALPFKAVFLPLLLVTVVPVTVGMLLRKVFFTQVVRCQKLLQRATGVVFVALVILLVIMNGEVLTIIWPQAGIAVLVLCVAAMLLGAGVAKLAGQSRAVCTTFAVEVGVQNAGTAMLVAATVLQAKSLVMLALCYGVMMNLPVLILWCWVRFHPQSGNNT